MRSLRLTLLPFLITFACAADREGVSLFKTKYSEAGHGNRFEEWIADCKTMPPDDVRKLYEWVSSGKWKKGERNLPKLPSPGSLVVRRRGTDRCWVISLLADVKHVTVKEGILDAEGIPVLDINTLKCVVTLKSQKSSNGKWSYISQKEKTESKSIARWLRSISQCNVR